MIKLQLMKKIELIKLFVMKLSQVKKYKKINLFIALVNEIRDHKDAIATLESSISDNEDIL